MQDHALSGVAVAFTRGAQFASKYSLGIGTKLRHRCIGVRFLILKRFARWKYVSPPRENGFTIHKELL